LQHAEARGGATAAPAAAGCSVRSRLQRAEAAAARGSSCSVRRAAARGSSVEGRRDCSMPIARGRRLQRSRGAEIRGGKFYFFTEVPLWALFVGQMPLGKPTKLHPPEIHQRTLISLAKEDPCTYALLYHRWALKECDRFCCHASLTNSIKRYIKNFCFSYLKQMHKTHKLRKLRPSNASSTCNVQLRTYHIPHDCRKKLKSALSDRQFGVFKLQALVSQTGLSSAAIRIWLTMFRRSVPYKKRAAYLANVAINDKVKVFYMIKSHSHGSLAFDPVLGQRMRSVAILCNTCK
jgi:hypothetical protein